MNQQVISGTSARMNPTPQIPSEIIHFPGMGLVDGRSFGINDDLFSRHFLLLGGSGCGKTNTFSFAVEQIRKNMTRDDVAIIFDTKGEFYEQFGHPGDYVIGNSPAFREKSHAWNIFGEILADGWEPYAVQTNAREIAHALFHGRGSESQPFFCNAARDIFQSVLLHFVRQAKANPDYWMPLLNNKDLTNALHTYRVQDYGKLFKAYRDFQYMLSYIGDGASNQALGVFGELNSMLAEYFVGILADNKPERSISMREAVRERGGKAIFIEYDLSLGESLTPVYRLLVDQALKEALGRGQKRGRCYLFVDEFKLLPKPQHIDDALNFGRGLGVRMMAGIQSIDQLYDIYGKDKGAVLASGFGSLLGFHTNDQPSREYIASRFGSNITVYQYTNQLRNTSEISQREGKTIEEWDQIQLGVGQAVIGLGDHPPFLYQFQEYRGT